MNKCHYNDDDAGIGGGDGNIWNKTVHRSWLPLRDFSVTTLNNIIKEHFLVFGL